MNENDKQIFTDEQRRELDRMFALVKERNEEILNILEDIQMQQKRGPYDFNIEKRIERLRNKIEKK